MEKRPANSMSTPFASVGLSENLTRDKKSFPKSCSRLIFISPVGELNTQRTNCSIMGVRNGNLRSLIRLNVLIFKEKGQFKDNIFKIVSKDFVNFSTLCSSIILGVAKKVARLKCGKYKMWRFNGSKISLAKIARNFCNSVTL